jgi:hypothetical protein
MDFDHAGEAIEAGLDCVRQRLPQLREALNLPEPAG